MDWKIWKPGGGGGGGIVEIYLKYDYIFLLYIYLKYDKFQIRFLVQYSIS